MRVLIDICHPAHVHFFRNPIKILTKHGHDVRITSRDKEMTLSLLDRWGLAHRCLSKPGSGGLLALGKELIERDIALFKEVRRFRPDVMAAIGGTFISHVGKLTGVPSIVFYDSANAKLQNAITYHFASCVVVPARYDAWLPRKRHIRYEGYHELSYLRPPYFQPDRQKALANGLSPHGDTFFLRLVAWKASHDLGQHGWNETILRKLIDKLSRCGRVLISSEQPLTGELAQFSYHGRVDEVHHVLALCRAYVGESATMASECAVLGVPAVFSTSTHIGNTVDQEKQYGLIRNVPSIDWASIETILDQILLLPRQYWKILQQKYLTDTIDVAAFTAKCIENYPELLYARPTTS